MVTRVRVRHTKAALGRKLIDAPGSAFQAWVTNRRQRVMELWRDHRMIEITRRILKSWKC